jgi:DNA-binding response OmpR family regulator
MQLSLLLVEDDPILGRSLKSMYEFEGYKVTWAQNFHDAVTAFNHDKFQCCTLDIGLPDGSGVKLCKAIRENDLNVPILFLTAQTDEDTLLEAFEAGGNDFVKKPFSQKELLARVRAITRNVVGNNETLTYKELVVNSALREAHYKGEKINFNNTEIQIFHFLVANAEKVVTRDRLIKFLGKENDIFDRTIDSHVSHIRKQLKDEKFISIQIKSIYGVGYKLEIE